MTDFKPLWNQALTFEQFLAASAPEHTGLWEGIYNLARVPEWAIQAGAKLRPLHLLVLAEDWCGDASNTIPTLAKWAAQVAAVDLRLLRRDEHPELMDRYLTNGSRSIPIVIALDADFRELGHWGPRPTELQAWVMANRTLIPKSELYPQVRRWYARDRGESTLREVLALAGVRSDLDPAA
ncbi:MAG: thioredoxin family protein [Gemmatimonadota bacterium]|nr:thioredoxin family protein [Gemmatimonadota bacterium]